MACTRRFSALVAVAAFCFASAVAAAPPDAEPFLLGLGDPSSCASLTRMSRPSDISPAAPNAIPPDAVALTGCTAEKTCFGGAVVSCSGSTSCTVDCGGVTCDSNQIECTCSSGCGTPAYCACRTCGGSPFVCFQSWCS